MTSHATGFLHKLGQVTLAQVIRWIIKGLLLLLLILFLVFAWFVLWPTSNIPEPEKVDQYVYLDQGWGEHADSAGRMDYYFTPQGTSMVQGTQEAAIRYDWFVHLELPFSNERFASPEHMRRFRFIVDPEPTPENPDQLPLGFTKHYNELIGQEVLDITCAACHSGEIHYTKDNTRYAIRIDGGQAMHAFTDTSRGNFAPVLLASLSYTWANPIKFDRFAKNVLGENYPNGKDQLSDDLLLSIEAFLKSGQNNPMRHLYPVEEGFGRTDALGRIGNTVFGDHLTADNYQAGSAPVSYPFVWNIWKFDWVQYNGSVAQPLARNIGEALGVGAVIPLVNREGNPLPEHQRFSSSVNIDGLNTIEQTLRKLQPPLWPEHILGTIDKEKAAKGQQLFEQYCQGCHGPHPATRAQQMAAAPLKSSPLDQWLIKVIESSEIGTDPTAAQAFMDRKYDISSTGVTNDDVTRVLMPLLQRQLNRNVLFRLTEVIEQRQEQSLPSAALETAKANYPDPNHDEVPGYPKDAFADIQQALSRDLSQPVSVVKDPRPEVAFHCDLQCQTEQLSWLTLYGQEQIETTARSWDVTSLTEGEALNVVGLLIKNKYYKDQQLDYQQQMELQGFGTIDLPQQVNGYKPRPLAGVWATPPFLHNGSVPSVYQMLLPPEQRTKQFYVGHRQYDPKHLGFVLKTPDDSDAEGFLMNTEEKGNWNTGHGFVADAESWKAFKRDHHKHPLPEGVIGPLLNDEERFAIIEYLKIKTDQFECIETVEADCVKGQWN